jgi:hypothetical protein
VFVEDAALTRMAANWYGTIIAPPKTGLYFLEVTDGKTVLKESFYYFAP